MEETQPPPGSAADILRENEPNLADLPTDLIKPYRDHLVALVDAAERRMRRAEDAYDSAVEEPFADHKIPDRADNPTELEWLTRRAAEADRDLALEQRTVELGERWRAWKTAEREFREAYLRINHLDHLLEGRGFAVGNDSLLAMFTLDLRDAQVEEAHSGTTLEIARERLRHARQAHKDVHAALRKAQRAAQRESKKAAQ